MIENVLPTLVQLKAKGDYFGFWDGVRVDANIKLYEDDKYIKEEQDPKTKNKLMILQDKIKGVYIGSIQENEELNLKDEILTKYNILTRAIKERRKVKILYYSYGKGENERIIDPAEMFLFQEGWYVAAFCERKKDIRHFELKRIIKYELLEEKYE